jgi:hypothetical protein
MRDERAACSGEPQVLAQREQRAVESLLENEQLTANLDDACAERLLDWGIACARHIVQGTAALGDEEAEQATTPRMRATRRLLRGVNRWVANRRETDVQQGAAALDQIVEQATVIYGTGYTPPSRTRRQGFLRMQFEYADEPQGLISALRQLVENQSDTDI